MSSSDMDTQSGKSNRRKTKLKKAAKPKNTKKRKNSDGPTCSMFLAELSRKLALKRKQEEEEQVSHNIIHSIIESLTNALPVIFTRKSPEKKESPMEIGKLQELAPELISNNTLSIPGPKPIVINEDVPIEEGKSPKKGTYKLPKMPVNNSDIFKPAEKKAPVTMADIAVNTGGDHDVANEIAKHVSTLRKISLIAEEFNQKTARNLKEIVDSVQLDLIKKLEEIEAEKRTAVADKQALISELESEDETSYGFSKAFMESDKANTEVRHEHYYKELPDTSMYGRDYKGPYSPPVDRRRKTNSKLPRIVRGRSPHIDTLHQDTPVLESSSSGEPGYASSSKSPLLSRKGGDYNQQTREFKHYLPKPSHIPRMREGWATRDKQAPAKHNKCDDVPHYDEYRVNRFDVVNINADFANEHRPAIGTFAAARPIPSLSISTQQQNALLSDPYTGNEVLVDWLIESEEGYMNAPTNSLDSTAEPRPFSIQDYRSNKNTEEKQVVSDSSKTKDQQNTSQSDKTSFDCLSPPSINSCSLPILDISDSSGLTLKPNDCTEGWSDTSLKKTCEPNEKGPDERKHDNNQNENNKKATDKDRFTKYDGITKLLRKLSDVTKGKTQTQETETSTSTITDKPKKLMDYEDSSSITHSSYVEFSSEMLQWTTNFDMEGNTEKDVNDNSSAEKMHKDQRGLVYSSSYSLSRDSLRQYSSNYNRRPGPKGNQGKREQGKRNRQVKAMRLRSFSNICVRSKLQKACRRHFNTAWHRATNKLNWTKSAKSNKVRLLLYLHRSMILTDAEVQTAFLLFADTGTCSKAHDQKSAAIVTSQRLSSWLTLHKMSSGMNKPLPNDSLMSAHTSRGPTMFFLPTRIRSFPDPVVDQPIITRLTASCPTKQVAMFSSNPGITVFMDSTNSVDEDTKYQQKSLGDSFGTYENISRLSDSKHSENYLNAKPPLNSGPYQETYPQVITCHKTETEVRFNPVDNSSQPFMSTFDIATGLYKMRLNPDGGLSKSVSLKSYKEFARQMAIEGLEQCLPSTNMDTSRIFDPSLSIFKPIATKKIDCAVETDSIKRLLTRTSIKLMSLSSGKIVSSSASTSTTDEPLPKVGTEFLRKDGTVYMTAVKSQSEISDEMMMSKSTESYPQYTTVSINTTEPFETKSAGQFASEIQLKRCFCSSRRKPMVEESGIQCDVGKTSIVNRYSERNETPFCKTREHSVSTQDTLTTILKSLDRVTMDDDTPYKSEIGMQCDSVKRKETSMQDRKVRIDAQCQFSRYEVSEVTGGSGSPVIKIDAYTMMTPIRKSFGQKTSMSTDCDSMTSRRSKEAQFNLQQIAGEANRSGCIGRSQLMSVFPLNPSIAEESTQFELYPSKEQSPTTLSTQNDTKTQDQINSPYLFKPMPLDVIQHPEIVSKTVPLVYHSNYSMPCYCSLPPSIGVIPRELVFLSLDQLVSGVTSAVQTALEEGKEPKNSENLSIKVSSSVQTVNDIPDETKTTTPIESQNLASEEIFDSVAQNKTLNNTSAKENIVSGPSTDDHYEEVIKTNQELTKEQSTHLELRPSEQPKVLENHNPETLSTEQVEEVKNSKQELPEEKTNQREPENSAVSSKHSDIPNTEILQILTMQTPIEKPDIQIPIAMPSCSTKENYSVSTSALDFKPEADMKCSFCKNLQNKVPEHKYDMLNKESTKNEESIEEKPQALHNVSSNIPTDIENKQEQPVVAQGVDENQPLQTLKQTTPPVSSQTKNIEDLAPTVEIPVQPKYADKPPPLLSSSVPTQKGVEITDFNLTRSLPNTIQYENLPIVNVLQNSVIVPQTAPDESSDETQMQLTINSSHLHQSDDLISNENERQDLPQTTAYCSKCSHRHSRYDDRSNKKEVEGILLQANSAPAKLTLNLTRDTREQNSDVKIMRQDTDPNEIQSLQESKPSKCFCVKSSTCSTSSNPKETEVEVIQVEEQFDFNTLKKETPKTSVGKRSNHVLQTLNQSVSKARILINGTAGMAGKQEHIQSTPKILNENYGKILQGVTSLVTQYNDESHTQEEIITNTEIKYNHSKTHSIPKNSLEINRIDINETNENTHSSQSSEITSSRKASQDFTTGDRNTNEVKENILPVNSPIQEEIKSLKLQDSHGSSKDKRPKIIDLEAKVYQPPCQEETEKYDKRASMPSQNVFVYNAAPLEEIKSITELSSTNMQESTTAQPELNQNATGQPSNDSQLIKTHEFNYSGSTSLTQSVENKSQNSGSWKTSVVNIACGPSSEMVYSSEATQGTNSNTSQTSSLCPCCKNKKDSKGQDRKSVITITPAAAQETTLKSVQQPSLTDPITSTKRSDATKDAVVKVIPAVPEISHTPTAYAAYNSQTAVSGEKAETVSSVHDANIKISQPSKPPSQPAKVSTTAFGKTVIPCPEEKLPSLTTASPNVQVFPTTNSVDIKESENTKRTNEKKNNYSSHSELPKQLLNNILQHMTISQDKNEVPPFAHDPTKASKNKLDNSLAQDTATFTQKNDASIHDKLLSSRKSHGSHVSPCLSSSNSKETEPIPQSFKQIWNQGHSSTCSEYLPQSSQEAINVKSKEVTNLNVNKSRESKASTCAIFEASQDSRYGNAVIIEESIEKTDQSTISTPAPDVSQSYLSRNIEGHEGESIKEATASMQKVNLRKEDKVSLRSDTSPLSSDTSNRDGSSFDTKTTASHTRKPSTESETEVQCQNLSQIQKNVTSDNPDSSTTSEAQPPKRVSTVDQVTSAETNKDVKELQVAPQFCETGTDAGTSIKQKSVGAFTSRHILPKPCCFHSGKKSCIDCMFVYDQPRCVVHRSNADASIQMCPSLHHVELNVQDVIHAQQSFVSFGSGTTSRHCEHKRSDNLSDVLPPRVYKAMYETGRLIAKVDSKLSKSTSRKSSIKSCGIETDTDHVPPNKTSTGIITSHSGCSRCICKKMEVRNTLYDVSKGKISKQSSSSSKQSASSETSQNPTDESNHTPTKPNHDSFTQSETVNLSTASQNSTPCDYSPVCDETKKQLLDSCKYYSNLLTKHIGRVRENLAKHLTPEQCILNIMTEMPCIEACTMKPSGRGELACQTAQTAVVPNVLSCGGVLATSVSLTDICRGNQDLNSVYYMLTAIEGRIRRLRKNLTN